MSEAPKYGRAAPQERRWARSKSLMRYAHSLRVLGYKPDQIEFECFIKPKQARNPKKIDKEDSANA